MRSRHRCANRPFPVNAALSGEMTGSLLPFMFRSLFSVFRLPDCGQNPCRGEASLVSDSRNCKVLVTFFHNRAAIWYNSCVRNNVRRNTA